MWPGEIDGNNASMSAKDEINVSPQTFNFTYTGIILFYLPDIFTTKLN